MSVHKSESKWDVVSSLSHWEIVGFSIRHYFISTYAHSSTSLKQ